MFAFSRRLCEQIAIGLAKMDFNSEEEKAQIKEVYDNALYSMLEEDRKLAQIESLLPLLQKGIGVHHSGLLPVLKELVEILFQEGLLKLLIATETFAMGVNMPARTVIFTQLDKFDGVGTRMITSGEYIQMSGRAGRRNKDKNGVCILMVGETMEKEEMRDMMVGDPIPLISKFRLTYTMLLNLARIRNTRPEEVVVQSFLMFQQQSEQPGLRKKLQELKQKYNSVLSSNVLADEKVILEYQGLASQHTSLKEQIWQYALLRVPMASYLNTGRIVYMQDPGDDTTAAYDGVKWGWGTIVDWERRYAKLDGLTVFVLLQVKAGPAHIAGSSYPSPHPDPDSILEKYRSVGAAACFKNRQSRFGNKYQRMYQNLAKLNANQISVVGFSLKAIKKMSALRIFLPSFLQDPQSLLATYNTMLDALVNFPSAQEVPMLDPLTHMGVSKDAIGETASKFLSLSSRIQAHPYHRVEATKREEALARLRTKQEIKAKLDDLEERAARTGLGDFKAEMQKKMRVLRRLGHLDSDGIITRKGRFACELDSIDTLLGAEVIFGGVTESLDAVQLVAFMTCLFPLDSPPPKGAKRDSVLPKDPKLLKAFESLRASVREVHRVESQCGLQDHSEEEYISLFVADHMMFTQAWCSGKSFAEVTEMTSMFEGSLIRLLRRTDELLERCHTSAMNIGDSQLVTKFKEGQAALKRGIVFAQSLYLE